MRKRKRRAKTRTTTIRRRSDKLSYRETQPGRTLIRISTGTIGSARFGLFGLVRRIILSQIGQLKIAFGSILIIIEEKRRRLAAK